MNTPRNLGAMVQGIAAKAVGKDWASYATLIAHWAEIVGPDLARGTTPSLLRWLQHSESGRREKGTLHIRLPGALALDIQHQEPIIKRRINGFFGYEAIERIVLDHCPMSPPPKVKKPRPPRAIAPETGLAIENIEDADLRSALRSLAEAIP